MRYLADFGRFWYDFIVGDDWAVALGVVAALVVTVILAQLDVVAWWLMPLAVLVLLTVSVRRGAR